MTTSSKSLTILEYDKIIARLAGLTETGAGRELALALTPSPVYAEVLRRQRLTAEARQLWEMKPNLSLAAARDVRELARQAALGHVLSAAELLDVQATLSLARSLRDTLGRLRVHLPLLAETADGIADFTDVVAEIGRCINQRAEVVDAASPVLAQLRRDARQAHDRLNYQLQRILSSPAGRQAAQEPIVTLRDGRYVIPIKAEMRGLIPGIVHDVSSSGATVFLEPLEAVELGNAWRELQLEEEREVQRILRGLSALVGEAADDIVAAVEALAAIDLALAKARLGQALGCSDLPYAEHDQPWLLDRATAPSMGSGQAPSAGSGQVLRLVNARHPLLTGHVVPITLWVGEDYSALLITGPNTGGKTVALKTVGLLALMAQAGLPVPAQRGSRLPVFDAVYADIGDEQSIEQSLSTFSSHMGNIIAILGEASRDSLVLLDELGAGTDPSEGSALAQAILRHLLKVGCLTLATTHHGQLKAFAHQTPGVMNASVEFDPKTLAPTYHLSIGLPGQSNALAIAQRLGLPEPILDDARQALPGGHLEVESLIVDLQRQREAAASARRAQEEARAQAEAIRQRLEEKLAAIETGRERLLEETRHQMERELAQARAQLREALRLAEHPERSTPSTSSGQALAAAQRQMEAVGARLSKLERRRRRRRPLPAIAAGDRLWLRDLPQPGEALSAPSEGEVEVRLGALRARIKLAHIERVEKAAAAAAAAVALRPPISGGPPAQLEVRGMTVEEAPPLIEQRLDEAFRAGLAQVRIVHGKGTGTLRRVVHGLLSKHPLVKSYALAPPKEGGEGVTVVELAH